MVDGCTERWKRIFIGGKRVFNVFTFGLNVWNN